MTRPRTWDTDAVLAAAGAIFHRQGYEATSLRDLEAATRLGAGSMYAAFGNKEGLFAAALQRYGTEVVASRVHHHLDEASDPRDGIRALFTSTFEDRPRPDPGCMITNSAIESPLLDAQARTLVANSLEVLRAGFARAAIRLAGESAAVDATAEQLLALYQGLLVLVRFGMEVSVLHTVVDAADILLDVLAKER